VNPEYKHPFLVTRPPKNVGIVVVSSDRGLCGALNTNVFKTTLLLVKEWQAKGATVNLCIIGSKGLAFFRRLGLPILASVTGLGDKPHVKDLLGTVKVMLDSYREGTLDRVFLVNATFVNTMTQKPEAQQILPVETLDGSDLQERWDYIYEPTAADILDGVLMRYIESQVYRGAVESVACEMAARMVAMKAASDNAGNLIGELQLVYNKARQAAITKELAEIVGGAAAV
jgi:F-type H+-transporting ATPase subunit gamma